MSEEYQRQEQFRGKPFLRLFDMFRRFYRDNVYAHIQNEVRGANFLMRNMNVPLMKAFKKEGPGFEIEYDGVPIQLSEARFLNPLLMGDTINGYLKGLDVNEGDTVVDGGAYGGTLSIYLAKKYGCRVIAVEPDPANAERLRIHCEMNDVVDRVDVVEKALWYEERHLSFEAEGSETSRVTSGGYLSVQTTTLDVLHEEYGGIDLVKLDIEGAEIPALKGGDNVLRDGAQITIETQEEDAERVEEFLEQYGYRTRTVHPLHQTTQGVKE